MSVYIKGMEKPKNCWECHFGHGETGICVVDFKSHGDWNEPQNCPLIPIHDHGRLVEADAVAEQIDEWIDAVGYATVGKGLSYYGELLGCIEDAPTIIPADKGGGK